MKKIFSHIINCTIIIICIFANFYLAKYTLNHEYIYGGIFNEKSLIYLIMFFSMLIGIFTTIQILNIFKIKKN